jgi:hypothetical protein
MDRGRGFAGKDAGKNLAKIKMLAKIKERPGRPLFSCVLGFMFCRGSGKANYGCSSISTESPKWISSMAKTIIPVAVVGVVPMITISPTERRGMSAT